MVMMMLLLLLLMVMGVGVGVMMLMTSMAPQNEGEAALKSTEESFRAEQQRAGSLQKQLEGLKECTAAAEVCVCGGGVRQRGGHLGYGILGG
jgi:Tfp pilus assembly protein PilN